MRVHKIIFTYLMISFSWFMLSTVYAAQNDPVGVLQYVANNMISGLKTHKATLKTKPQIVYDLAYRFVVPHADLSEMSRRVVPPQIWNHATAAERQKFQREFTRTLIRTYASALSSYQDQTVKFYPVRGGNGNSVEVNSDILSSQNEPIRVSYRLVRAGNAWKLFDLSVEGVDMLDSFRSQFSDILSRGSMRDLLNQMSEHNQGRRG